MNIADPVGNGVQEELIHQPHHRGIRLRRGGQGGRIHREDLVHRVFQQASLDVVPVDRLPHVPFGRGEEANGATQVLFNRVAVGDIERIAHRDHDRPIFLHGEGEREVAKGEFPRNEIENLGADDLFANVGDFRAGSLGDVGGDDAGINELQIPQAFRQGHALAACFSLRQIHLRGSGVSPHHQPLP